MGGWALELMYEFWAHAWPGGFPDGVFFLGGLIVDLGFAFVVPFIVFHVSRGWV